MAGVDWWALGVLTYELVKGSSPFAAATPRLLFANILRAAPAFQPGDCSAWSGFVSRLLAKVPSQRLASLYKARSEPFFADVAWAAMETVAPPKVPDLPSFVRREDDGTLCCATLRRLKPMQDDPDEHEPERPDARNPFREAFRGFAKREEGA